LHAQYYQDDRVIDLVAQCIAAGRPPESAGAAAAGLAAGPPATPSA
jgi:hypothetical protein